MKVNRTCARRSSLKRNNWMKSILFSCAPNRSNGWQLRGVKMCGGNRLPIVLSTIAKKKKVTPMFRKETKTAFQSMCLKIFVNIYFIIFLFFFCIIISLVLSYYLSTLSVPNWIQSTLVTTTPCVPKKKGRYNARSL